MRRTESEIFAVIKPSNSYETCQLIISRYGKAERAARSWNPTADDLTADDWNYSESKDYGELRQKCKKYCTGLLYRDKDMGNYVKGCFEKLFIHDLRDAQITHLSD